MRFPVEWLCSPPRASSVVESLYAYATRTRDTLHSATWCRENQIVSIGAADERIASVHPVEQVQSLPILAERMRALCDGLNPHAEGGDFSFADEVAAVRAETGLILEITVPAIRKALASARTPHRSSSFGLVRARLSPDETARVRRILREALQRESNFQNEGLSSYLFVLEDALGAPLSHGTHEDGHRFTVANLGYGHVLHLDIERYPNEPANALTWTFGSAVVADGGDLRLQLTLRTADYLEASRTERRRVRAAAE